jgi:O-glycosyl hydrolase
VVRSFSITTTYGAVERALVAFHCYAGGYKNQAAFTAAFPNKEVYFTECTGYVHSCPPLQRVSRSHVTQHHRQWVLE